MMDASRQNAHDIMNPPENAESVRAIIEGTSEEVFEIAGGFDFTDELAVKLNAKWSKAQGPVVVSQIDLAWLIDGYARARLAMPHTDGTGIDPDA